jgi:hypothetical protein
LLLLLLLQMRATRRLTTLYISKVSSFTLRIAEFVTLFVIGLHWNACTQFLVAVSTGFPEGSWVEQLGEPTLPPLLLPSYQLTFYTTTASTHEHRAVRR